MSTGKILLGVLAGVAVGATLGILFAPDKGLVTRKKITTKSDEYAEQLADKFNEFIESIMEKVENLKDAGIQMEEEVKEKVKDAMEDVADKVN